MMNVTTPRPMGLFAALTTLGVLVGCFPGAPYDCVGICHENRSTIAAVGYTPSDERLDEDTLCESDAVANATDACACREAMETEFRLQLTALTCDCPREGDAIPEYQDDCSIDFVPADAQSCFSHGSPQRLIPQPPHHCIGS